jgi:hypothetical protein
MLYWETADQDPSLDNSMLEWAPIWKSLPKVVFSTTLPAVQGNARLACGALAEEIERSRAEPAEGSIAIGGAALAAEAAALGLIDEYRDRVYPVLVGGGIPSSSARAPGGSRTRRGSRLQHESRLPPLPSGALVRSSAEPYQELLEVSHHREISQTFTSKEATYLPWGTLSRVRSPARGQCP